MKVAVDPIVAAFEPDFAVALMTPGGERGIGDLVAGEAFEVLAGGDQVEGGLIVVAFAEEVIEELRSFVPPVSVEFGVIGGDNQGRAIHESGEVFHLGDAVVEEVAGMVGGGVHGVLFVVGFFVGNAFAGDAVVFYAGIDAQSAFMDVRADVIEFEVESDIAVEFAVSEIAGVSFFGGPYGFGGFLIATEGGYSGGSKKRGIDAVFGAFVGEEDAVGIDEKETDTGFGKVLVQARIVSAFAIPDASGGTAEMLFIGLSSDDHLGPGSDGIDLKQGLETVGGAAGDDFEKAVVLKGAEARQ